MRVGFIGWRGMVGSVLMGRMHEEKDFNLIDPVLLHYLECGRQGARDRKGCSCTQGR